MIKMYIVLCYLLLIPMLCTGQLRFGIDSIQVDYFSEAPEEYREGKKYDSDGWMNIYRFGPYLHIFGTLYNDYNSDIVISEFEYRDNNVICIKDINFNVAFNYMGKIYIGKLSPSSIFDSPIIESKWKGIEGRKIEYISGHDSAKAILFGHFLYRTPFFISPDSSEVVPDTNSWQQVEQVAKEAINNGLTVLPIVIQH